VAKPISLKFSTADLTQHMQLDFLETQEKQEMVSVSEISQAMLSEKTYIKDLYETLARGKKATEGDFFIEVIRTHEPGRRKMFRRRQFWTNSCSTPTPGSAIYQYTRADDKLDLLWDLPPTTACAWAFRNKKELTLTGMGNVLPMIMDYYDGTLLKRAKKINGEYDGKGSAVIRICNDERIELERERNHAGGNS